MAKVEGLTTDTIIKMRGYLDYYKYANKYWICRLWPEKPSPPYTPLQAEFQNVFRCSKKILSHLSDDIVESWRKCSGGRSSQWIDTITGIFLGYYKNKGVFPPVAVDYKISIDGSLFRVEWYLYYDFDFNADGGSYIWKVTDWLNISDFMTYKGYAVISLFTDDGFHLVAPWLFLQL